MELKYLVLKLSNRVDIVVIRDELNKIIGKRKPFAYMLKWKDIADILINSEDKS
jgi:hypothetical protein